MGFPPNLVSSSIIFSKNWTFLKTHFSTLDLKIPRSLYLQMLHIDGWIEGKYDLFLVSNENRNETSVTETHVFQ